jgi:fructose-specific phosphotransferase system component IIB
VSPRARPASRILYGGRRPEKGSQALGYEMKVETGVRSAQNTLTFEEIGRADAVIIA